MSYLILEAKDLVVAYEEKVILKGVNLRIPEEKISVIIGSNGCGKSTLLKSFCRLTKPKGGEILLNQKNLFSYPPKEVAKKISLMPQSPLIPEGITVYDLVSRGRFPYRKLFGGLSSSDFQAIEEAMEFMKITDLRDRLVDELSGGQRQRVWIALALAQETDILFLDEPTTFLDIAYQIEILDLLSKLNKKKKLTIVMVLHDINLSIRYAHHLFALKEGALFAEGSPHSIITKNLIEEVFRLKCEIHPDPITGAPMILPLFLTQDKTISPHPQA